MQEIVVITCPGGKQCPHLIRLLYDKSRFKLRLAGHTTESASHLQNTYPEAEVQTCDTTSLTDCRKLLSNATSVYHVGPSLHSREQEIGMNMIDAAVAESQKPDTNFKHFVYSSVLGTQHRNLMQHDHKCRVEERLLLSPLNFTILQPTNFMDAYPTAALANIEDPSIEYLWGIYNPNVANSLIALRDLAEAAARVLDEREPHYFAQYPLCSTFPVSDAEAIKVIGKHIGKEIKVPTPTFEEGVSKLLKFLYTGESGMYSGDHVDSDLRWPASQGDLRPDITKDQAERLILFYNRRGLKGNPSVLRWLIGREPTSVDEWVKIQLKG
ncbi:hypothetical protein N7447_009775 [Penicillium robsamsonii]|uniref:uncharacterized protein n=1 Tax=Penicillium robsamsonii TaxID=1792511 RepID=UPI0025481207|nr:uncharacterized protein N7447_009775 [Penicillium robsamsonii]KAJ5812752.1 hypothetical protein N7447_009775 [Penicillium robsamsonii]